MAAFAFMPWCRIDRTRFADIILNSDYALKQETEQAVAT
jgi:hypothetical protein